MVDDTGEELVEEVRREKDAGVVDLSSGYSFFHTRSGELGECVCETGLFVQLNWKK